MNPAEPRERQAISLTVPATKGSLHCSPLQGIEYRFGLVLAIFGLAYVFILPPVQAPDESVHLFHAYDVAQGHLLPAHAPEGWAGTVVPVSLLPIVNRHARFWGHLEERWTRQDIQEMLDLRFTEEQRPVSMAHGSIYNFFPYLPPAAGIRLARWLEMRPLLVFYAGRLGNLAFAVFCVVLAIRLTPIGKLLFGAIALIPMSVQQFGSLSADAPTMALSLVLVAVLLRLALLPSPSRRSALTLGLLLLIFTVALSKFPYTALALLYFGIPPGQGGSRRRYWLTGTLVLAVAAAGIASSIALTNPYLLDPHRIMGVTVSKSAQTHYVLTHPFRYVWICLSNVAENGFEWLYRLFILGSLDTPLNRLTSMGYLFFLAVLAVAEGGPKIELPWRLWTVGAAITFLSVNLILTSQYLWWNPVASRVIEGPQGRYIIPLLPMLLLLRNGGIRATADERFLARNTLAICGLFLTYAGIALANRFYFRQPPLLLRPPALLALGFLALSLCWARSRWLQNREAPEKTVSSTLDATSPTRLAA